LNRHNSDDFRIVFLEDSHEFSLALSGYFSLAKYNVVTLSSIEALLSYVESVPDCPHVFVLDRFLQDGQVEDVFELISSIPRSRFLILTAYPSFQSSVVALRNRAVEYLVKPVSLQDLENKIVDIWKEISSSIAGLIHRDHEWDALIRTYLNRSDITLLAVQRCGEIGVSPSLSNITTVVGYSMSTVHRGVKDLVRSGLAEYSVTPRDKRVKIYQLTDLGVARIQATLLKLKKYQQTLR